MWIIKNLFAFACWIVMSWLLFQRKELWLTVCGALMCAAPLARYAMFRVDVDKIPAHVGTSRFSMLQTFTAMTIAKACGESGGTTASNPQKGNRLEKLI